MIRMARGGRVFVVWGIWAMCRCEVRVLRVSAHGDEQQLDNRLQRTARHSLSLCRHSHKPTRPAK